MGAVHTGHNPFFRFMPSVADAFYWKTAKKPMSATAAEKAAFNERIKPVKMVLEGHTKAIAGLREEIKRAPAEPKETAFKLRWKLMHRILAETALYMVGSRLSQKYLQIKNETYLNEARKNFYVFYQTAEEMVGNAIDSLDERPEELEVLEGFADNLVRFEMFQKAGFLLNKLERLYGDGSKWKWSFVDLEGRLVTGLKNITFFKTLQRDLDPSIAGYKERMDLMEVIEKIIEKAAERYRNKYELTGKAIDDMKNALAFVSFQKRLAAVMGDNDLMNLCKKKIDTWTKKLNDDYSSDEQKKALAARMAKSA